MMENGTLPLTRGMGMECKYGRMGAYMRAAGRMERHMERADISTLMVMCMMVCGNMIWRMAEVNILMLTARTTMATGPKTNKKERVIKNGQMDHHTMVIT